MISFVDVASKKMSAGAILPQRDEVASLSEISTYLEYLYEGPEEKLRGTYLYYALW